MEGLRRQEQSRQEKISKAKEDLAAAELELANLPHYEPPKDKLVSICVAEAAFFAIDLLINSTQTYQSRIGASMIVDNDICDCKTVSYCFVIGGYFCISTGYVALDEIDCI